MISHRLDLSEVNEGLDRLRRAEGIRTVLEVGGS
jgi:Zn-dependent alcohol dehydrogenase